MADEPILIIGAGIGGLACAAALGKAGFPVRVLEQAPALGEVGAGVGLWTNAVRCLDRLGVSPSLWERSFPIRSVEGGSAEGASLMRFDVAPLAREYGAHSYVVHRAELHAALAALSDPRIVSLGARVVALEQDPDGVTVRLADGSTVRGGLVIGADGLWSSVRASILGEQRPLYSGQTCYRAVAELTAEEPHTLREVAGRGLRCAVCALDEGRVYWWATRAAPEGERDDPLERKALLAELFRGFAFGFPQALEATEPGAILRNDLYDRPPVATWSAGRVTLLGDAAHPTTPNLGQGACMAIEDAIVLARALAIHDGDHAAAFAAYERARMPRTDRIVKQSRALGAMNAWSSPLAAGLRDLALRLTPSFVTARMMRQQIGYDAGVLVPRG